MQERGDLQQRENRGDRGEGKSISRPLAAPGSPISSDALRSSGPRKPVHSLAFAVDGPLRLWDENGERLLYGEYTRGRKNGLVCLFFEAMPWWIQEWDKGVLVHDYLIKFAGGAPTVIPRAKLGPENAKDSAGATKKLSKLEAETERDEGKLKKQLMAWFRKEDKRVKRERAANLAPLRRQAIIEREQARRAAGAAVIRAMEARWRRRMGR